MIHPRDGFEIKKKEKKRKRERKKERETVSNLSTRGLNEIKSILSSRLSRKVDEKKKSTRKRWDGKKRKEKNSFRSRNATSLSVTNPVHVRIEADFVETFLRGFLWIRLVCHRSRC